MEDHYAKDGSFSLLDQLGSNSVLWPGMLAARGRVVPHDLMSRRSQTSPETGSYIPSLLPLPSFTLNSDLPSGGHCSVLHFSSSGKHELWMSLHPSVAVKIKWVNLRKI